MLLIPSLIATILLIVLLCALAIRILTMMVFPMVGKDFLALIRSRMMRWMIAMAMACPISGSSRWVLILGLTIVLLTTTVTRSPISGNIIWDWTHGFMMQGQMRTAIGYKILQSIVPVLMPEISGACHYFL